MSACIWCLTRFVDLISCENASRLHKKTLMANKTFSREHGPERDYLKLRTHSPSPSYDRKGSPISVDHISCIKYYFFGRKYCLKVAIYSGYSVVYTYLLTYLLTNAFFLIFIWEERRSFDYLPSFCWTYCQKPFTWSTALEIGNRIKLGPLRQW